MERICYVLGAWHTEQAQICRAPEDLVIAADGGYAALESLGLTADLVVGDFDSLGYVPQGEEVICHPVMKDDTDMMLAVQLGLERGYRNFVLLGSIGGRLDHTLANIQTLLYLKEQGCNALLYGEGTAITAVQNGSLQLGGNGVFSVYCLSGVAHGVTERGFVYGLEGADMVSAYPSGISNEFLPTPGTISVEDGCLVVLWYTEKEELPDLIARL